MKTSLFSRILSDNDEDAALLDAWLSERHADKALQPLENDQAPFSVDAQRLGKAAAPHDKGVAPGQIRILSPKLVCGDDAIPYIAVLDHWMEDLWLIAPYSPYSYPASDGEMVSGDMLVGRRVLQCWNARTAHESLVAQSYVAGTLDESVRADALALFRHVAAGAPLPDSFAALVGAPVLSKADPRREYLAESVARYAPLTSAARETEAALALEERRAAFREALAERLAAPRDRFAEYIRVPAYGTPDYALVAGDRSVQKTETFIVSSLGVELDVKFTQDEGKVRLVIYKDGEIDGSALEGVVVANREAMPVGEIRNGVFVADGNALKDGFLLIDPDTLNPIPVTPEGEENR